MNICMIWKQLHMLQQRCRCLHLKRASRSEQTVDGVSVHVTHVTCVIHAFGNDVHMLQSERSCTHCKKDGIAA